MSNKNYQRRKFIKNGAMGMAAFTIVPRHVIGRGYVAPSDKLRIAGIGACDPKLSAAGYPGGTP